MGFSNPEYVYGELCPNLRGTPHRVVSKATDHYNCLSFAAGDRRRKWDPYGHRHDRGLFGYWPIEHPRELSLAAFEAAYASLGYEPCDSPDFERDCQKIAFYVRDDEVQHVALQPSDRKGIWKSKLGNLEDIEHELEAIAREQSYGFPTHFMRRSRAKRPIRRRR